MKRELAELFSVYNFHPKAGLEQYTDRASRLKEILGKLSAEECFSALITRDQFEKTILFYAYSSMLEDDEKDDFVTLLAVISEERRFEVLRIEQDDEKNTILHLMSSERLKKTLEMLPPKDRFEALLLKNSQGVYPLDNENALPHIKACVALLPSPEEQSQLFWKRPYLLPRIAKKDFNQFVQIWEFFPKDELSQPPHLMRMLNGENNETLFHYLADNVVAFYNVLKELGETYRSLIELKNGENTSALHLLWKNYQTKKRAEQIGTDEQENMKHILNECSLEHLLDLDGNQQNVFYDIVTGADMSLIEKMEERFKDRPTLPGAKQIQLKTFLSFGDLIIYRNRRLNEASLNPFGFTKQEKIDAVDSFIKGLLIPGHYITAQERKVLKDGRLGNEVSKFLTKISSDGLVLDSLVNHLNIQSPKEALIYRLNAYRLKREKENTYHYWGLFGCCTFSKSEKLDAVDALINKLNGDTRQLTERQKATLLDGRLKGLIDETIEHTLIESEVSGWIKVPAAKAVELMNANAETNLMNNNRTII